MYDSFNPLTVTLLVSLIVLLVLFILFAMMHSKLIDKYVLHIKALNEHITDMSASEEKKKAPAPLYLTEDTVKKVLKENFPMHYVGRSNTPVKFRLSKDAEDAILRKLSKEFTSWYKGASKLNGQLN